MSSILYLVTGGSKGLGLELVKAAAATGGHVIVFSRSPGPELENVKYCTADLSNFSGVSELVQQELLGVELSNFEAAVLVNNAGTIEPIGPTKGLSSKGIQNGISINLVAPIVITSSFLNVTGSLSLKKIIVNISSGVAKSPIANWAVYSASKAGIENFSMQLIEEYRDDSSVRIANFNPGLVDTGMQATIRNSGEGDFPGVERFVDFKKEGRLRSAQVVAGALFRVIRGETAVTEGDISIDELL